MTFRFLFSAEYRFLIAKVKISDLQGGYSVAATLIFAKLVESKNFNSIMSTFIELAIYRDDFDIKRVSLGFTCEEKILIVSYQLFRDHRSMVAQ